MGNINSILNQDRFRIDNTSLMIEDCKLKKKNVVDYIKQLAYHYPMINTLDIRDCKLKSLPPSITQIGNLHTLILVNNKLSELPWSLPSSTQSTASIANDNLQKLDLSQNHYSKFPSCVLVLQNLTSLVMDNNQLSDLEIQMSSNSGSHPFIACKLKELRLANNNFQQFPDLITDLVTLQILDISGNSLSTIPSSFSKMSALRYLNLKSNKFTSFPANICTLSQLTHLNLSYNSIQINKSNTLGLSFLPSLEKLELQHNKFGVFPTDICDIQSLKILKIQNNDFDQVPDQIGNLVNLVELFLTENSLTTLPPRIGDLVSLKKLYLEFNKISKLPVEFKKLVKLNILIMHSNDIKQFPSELLSMKHLLRLSLDDNPLPEMKQIKNHDGGAIGYLKQLQNALNPDSGSHASRKESMNKSKKKKTLNSNTLSRALYRGNSNVDNEVIATNTNNNNNSNSLNDIIVSSSIQEYEDEIQKIIQEQNQTKQRRSSVFVPPTTEIQPKSPRMATSTPSSSILTSTPSQAQFTPISQSGSISSPSLLTSTNNLAYSLQQSTTNFGSSGSSFLMTSTANPGQSNTSSGMNNSGGLAPNRVINLGTSSSTLGLLPNSSPVQTTTPISTQLSQIPLSDNNVPSFSKFKPVFEQLLEDQDFSKKKRENLQKLSKQEKWNLLLQYKNSTLKMLHYKPIDTNSPPQSSTTPTSSGSFLGSPVMVSQPSSTSSTPPLPQKSSSILPTLVSNLNLKQAIQNQFQGGSQNVHMFATAKFYCEYLTTETPEINILKDLYELLKEGGTEISSFIDNGGIDKILTVLKYNIDNPETQDQEKVGFCLLILKLLVEVATKSVLITENSIATISMLLNSDSYHIISIILDIYDEVVQVPNIGSNIIIESLTRFQKSKHLSSPYVPLIALLKNPIYEVFTKSIIFKIINTLIYSFHILEERFTITCQFMKLGILDIIRNLRPFCSNHLNEHLKFELDMFEEVLDNDETELIKKIGRKEVLRRMSNEESSTSQDTQQTAMATSTDQYVHVVMVSAGYGDFKIKLTDKTTYSDITSFIQSRYQLKSDISKYGLFLPSIGNTENTDQSKWVDESKTLVENSLSGEIVEFRMKHVKVKVIISMSSITPTKDDDIKVSEILIDPQMKCFEIVNYLRTKLDPTNPAHLTLLSSSQEFEEESVDSESDVYGIYHFQSINDYQQGQWWPLNSRLLEFKFTDYLEIKLRQRCIRIGFKSGNEKLFKFDPYQTISYLTKLITIEIGLKLNSEDYGLHFESSSASQGNLSLSKIGKWLEPEKLLFEYPNIKNHLIYFKFRPRIISVTISAESGISVTSSTTDFKNNMSISQIIESVCASNNLDPSLYSLYKSNPEGQKIKLLSRQNSLRDQNINSSDYLLLTSKQKDLPSDFNIWDEPVDSPDNIRMTNSNKISSISINKLIEKLTSIDNTMDISSLRNTFLTTYRSFITPQILLSKLLERYTIPTDFNKEKGDQIQRKVRTLFKAWVDTETKVDRAEVLTLISNNLPSQTADDDGSKELFEFLSELINSKSYDQQPVIPINNIVDLPKTKVSKDGFSLGILDYDEVEIAKQITLLLFPIFSKIEISELIGMKWCKNPNMTPNITESTTIFNKLANWVSYSIVSQSKIRERSYVMTKLIKIANYFFELKNFFCLMAVISGLNTSAVLRLKYTKNKLSKNSKQNLEELEQIMSTSAGLKNYRPVLAESQPPCIPFIGIVLSDLVFIEEGNTQLDETRINYKKLEYIYNSVATVQKYSIVPYQFKPVQTIQKFFLDYKVTNDKELHELSLKCEPRGATRTMIE
ncbi:RasGEF domain-containing protein [Tieghemostelium lacteum]|uniref:RasGEF domain-containing protein n=1 Tax=Tieghemostelium lacteum TaxID=361077 RepID=A0A151ZE55_TIELA|nr:RasGEF domain-containing protein [Tieghemostelium lacteum]|eukprot:KYQ92217.1 RasGEF domain-containing protein [Tieghemostelium lacteum]